MNLKDKGLSLSNDRQKLTHEVNFLVSLPHLYYSLSVLQLINDFKHGVLKRMRVFKASIVLLSQQVNYFLDVSVFSVTLLESQFRDYHKSLLHQIKDPLVTHTCLSDHIIVHWPL